LALPLYAVTLFVSAFILFLVQPIVGKIILPKLGGTPQVWNTCMVFFQMVLLAGYAYTHNATTRLNLRQQLIAHVVLLALPLAILLPFPFTIGDPQMVDGVVTNPNSLWGFVPDLGSNPIPSTLAVLFLYVALPFVVVATTAPLLQKWFVHTGHPASKDPYFLYGASNFGSMLSLILYPVVIEPYLGLHLQGWTYVVGYICLMAFVLACALMVWNSKEVVQLPKQEPSVTPAPPPAADTGETGIAAGAPVPTPAPATAMKPGAPPMKGPKGAPGKLHGGSEQSIALSSADVTPWRRFRWVMLAAIPSSLMLGITTHITTDLSPMPLFWLVPLILYLGSFILVFMKWPIVWTEKAHVYFLYGQPLCIALMIMVDVLNLTGDTTFLVFAIFAHVLGFFATTMVCHGELAKDRPSTKHLTEFYLWMSVGGMLGGMFNGLVAPVIFPKLWELPLAIFAAVLVRPKMFDVGVLDNFLASLFEGKAEPVPVKAGGRGAKHAPTIARSSVEANESLVKTLDYVWPIGILVLCVALMMILDPARSMRNKLVVFGLPLAIACLCMTRPIRVGLGVGFVLLVFYVNEAQGDRSIASARSYFGAMSVKEYASNELPVGGGKKEAFKFRQLIHGHIDHGMNFLKPAKKEDRGSPLRDRSRLATTYYHREGPAGRVMEKFNWFAFKDGSDVNMYQSDVRMPANLVTGLMADIGSGCSLPMTALVAAWTEPPFATVGLGTGTMASYGRVYQHVHFYEIDNVVLGFSLAQPTRLIHNYKDYAKVRDESPRSTYFNYLDQAIERGSIVQVLMGDARLRMALPYKNHYKDPDGPDDGGGPESFYHMMVVDAFSSDAIPAHLLTREAFKMYFDRLTPDGILCVHTSNRFVDLPKVVAAISKDMNLTCQRGHDSDTERDEGHYTSEWVMVARDAKHLERLRGDTNFLTRYMKKMRAKSARGADVEEYWTDINSNPRYLWTDDYYNLLSVVRFRARSARED